MRTLAVKVPEELDERLDDVAKKRGPTKSSLVREALARLLDEKEPRPHSVVHAAARYVGCLEGPGDLSTNPKHLEGFGR